MPTQDHTAQAVRSAWSIPSMKATVQVCLQDVRPYLNRLEMLRFRVFLLFFAVTTQREQHAFSAQSSPQQCLARAEGVTRLYLGCRQSLAFYNQFPVVLNLERQKIVSGADCAQALIFSLCKLIQNRSRFASLLSNTRQPRRHCDQLQGMAATKHCVILRNGVVFSIPLTNNLDCVALRCTIDQIIKHKPNTDTQVAVRLGDLSVLPRETWFRLQTHLTDVPAVSDALMALQEAAFIVCLEDETQPTGIGALGQSLRFGNFGNRYFDKSLQFVVFGNGEAGFLCDHAVMDGVDAIQLAEEICANMPETNSLNLKTASDSTIKPIWLEMDYQLPLTVLGKHTKHVLLQHQNRTSFSVEWTEFDGAYFDSKTLPADSLIQIAIQLAFYRCIGRLPSVFEPVNLNHMPGGRLEFISPVSVFSSKLIDATQAGASLEQRRALLVSAVKHHRQEIRRAKQGLGNIGHLLALSALEVPHNRSLGVALLRIKEAGLSALDAGSRLMITRDIVASNGGCSDAVKLFGTIVHKNNMIGIGYMAKESGLVVDIQANGRYAKGSERFKQALFQAMLEIGSLA
jgi:carnitine O-acetyltransferase